MSGGIANNSTESAIFGYIDSNDGGDDTSINTDEGIVPEGDAGNTPDPDSSLQRQVNDRKTRESANPDDDLIDPLGKGNQPDKRNQRPDPNKDNKNKPQGRVRTNERGDLVDERGNVIASAGRERRLAAESHRLRGQLENLQNRNVALARQIEEGRVLNGLPQQYGLDNNDVGQALAIAAQFKSNPILAVRQLAQMAMSQGIELADIFDQENLPELGVKATKTLLDQRLKPFEEERNRQADVERVNTAAQEQADQFLGDYPDAAIHQQDVALLMSEIIEDYKARNQTITPYLAAERAWQILQAFGQEHGLDLSQPFRPQVEARARARQSAPNGGNRNSTSGNQQPSGQRRTRPMPNGTGSSNTSTVQNRSNLAGADESWDSIVRASMRESGLDI